MSEDKNTEKTQDEIKPPEADLQTVMSGGGMFQSPLFWGIMVFIPIAMTLFISVKNARQEAPAVEAVVAEEIVPQEEIRVDPNARMRPSRGRAPIN